MAQIQSELERRRFLKLGSVVAASIALASGVGKIFAQAAHVDENETKAQNLGYRNDATGVDRTKFSKYAPGQICASCQFYKGTPGEAWGPCQIFSGRQVSANGWCVSYWKKV